MTVITGPTDSGKTAIIRALRWLYYNAAPPGDFIRTGCTYAKVVVESLDETEIERVRTPSKNQYIIRRCGEEPKVYEGFGVRVPLEVQQALGVMPIRIADIDVNLNLAEQLDPPFLGKAISPPNKARVLGHLAGTEQIEQANKTLGTDIYRADQEEKQLGKDIEEKQVQIAEYHWVPTLQEKIHKLDIIISDLKTKEQLKENLAGLVSRLVSNSSQTRDVTLVLDRLSYLPQLERYLDVLPNQIVKLDRLHSFRYSLSCLNFSITETLSTLNKLAHIDELTEISHKIEANMSRYVKLKTIQGNLSNLMAEEQTSIDIISETKSVDEALLIISSTFKMIQRITKLLQLQSRFVEATENIRRAMQTMEKAISDTQRAEQLYIDELVSAGKCPLCGSIVDPQIIKEVV